MKKEIWIFYIVYWEKKKQESKRIEYGFKKPVTIHDGFIHCVIANMDKDIISIECLNSPMKKV